MKKIVGGIDQNFFHVFSPFEKGPAFWSGILRRRICGRFKTHKNKADKGTHDPCKISVEINRNKLACRRYATNHETFALMKAVCCTYGTENLFFLFSTDI